MLVVDDGKHCCFCRPHAFVSNLPPSSLFLGLNPRFILILVTLGSVLGFFLPLLSFFPDDSSCPSLFLFRLQELVLLVLSLRTLSPLKNLASSGMFDHSPAAHLLSFPHFRSCPRRARRNHACPLPCKPCPSLPPHPSNFFIAPLDYAASVLFPRFSPFPHRFPPFGLVAVFF